VKTQDYPLRLITDQASTMVNPKHAKDLGQRAFGQEYHDTFQAIAGSYCKFCRERAYDHHLHYLYIEDPKLRPPPPEPIVTPEPTGWPELDEDSNRQPKEPEEYVIWKDDIGTEYWTTKSNAEAMKEEKKAKALILKKEEWTSQQDPEPGYQFWPNGNPVTYPWYRRSTKKEPRQRRFDKSTNQESGYYPEEIRWLTPSEVEEITTHSNGWETQEYPIGQDDQDWTQVSPDQSRPWSIKQHLKSRKTRNV